MLKLLSVSASSAAKLMRFDLRQGFPQAALDSDTALAHPNFSSTNNTGYPRLRHQKKGKRAIMVSGGTGSNFFLWNDFNNPAELYSPPVSFSGSVFVAEINEMFYAVGGDSPFLYVFSAVDDTFIPVDTTGLGRVVDLKFSDDNSKMVVVHNTAPNIRIYNTADWTFQEPAGSIPAGINRQAVSFSKDNTHIFTIGLSPPYISVFKADMSERTRVETSSNYACYNNAKAEYHPYKENTIMVANGAGSTSARKVFYEYNIVSGVATDIFPTDKRVPCTAFSVCLAFDLIYCAHGYIDESDGTRAYTSVIRLSDYTRIGRLPELELVTSAVTTITDFTVIETDLHKVSGTVRDINNDPAERLITAHYRDNGKAVARATSDPVTGNYELILPDSKEVDIQFHTADGELLNDLFYARVIPEPMT